MKFRLACSLAEQDFGAGEHLGKFTEGVLQVHVVLASGRTVNVYTCMSAPTTELVS